MSAPTPTDDSKDPKGEPAPTPVPDTQHVIEWLRTLGGRHGSPRANP